MKMKKKNKSLLNKAFSLIGDPDVSAVQFRKQIIETLSRKEFQFTAAEKNALVRKLVKLKQLGPGYASITSVIKDTMHLVSQIERREDTRAKKKIMKETLEGNRDQTLPVIFYLCSYHEKPAEGHKDYQGKIYVDQSWRSVMKPHQDLWWLEEPIRAFIKDKKIMTVQSVTVKPPYLIYRPYCKHHLIPLNTWDVLTMSVSELKAEHPEAVMGTGNKSKNQYRKEYQATVQNLKEKIKEKTRVKA